jgi:hypothetical protein
MEAIEFYQSVSVTNPSMVKKAKLHGQTVDTIDPTYQQEVATKAFNGLYGSNWGIKNIEFTTRKYSTTEIMTLNGVFFYPQGSFPYAVSGKSFYVSRQGNDVLDTDIEKKLLTSFKSKCLSLLGFNSDIFLNKFSDQDYLTDAFNQHQLCNPTQQQELRKQLGYYGVDAGLINKHFAISTLNDLLASDYNEALALIQQFSIKK